MMKPNSANALRCTDGVASEINSERRAPAADAVNRGTVITTCIVRFSALR